MDFGIDKCAMLLTKRENKNKKSRKRNKYLNLTIELRELCNMRVMVIPTEVGAHGM